MSADDAVVKGEEGVRTQCDTGKAVQVCALGFVREGIGAAGKVFLPCAFRQHVFLMAVYIAFYHVIPLGTANGRQEGKRKHLVGLS